MTPSWSKSPAVTENGNESGKSPTPKVSAAENLPLPSFSNIDRFVDVPFVTARSISPSASKSAAAMDEGPVPAAN